MPETYKEYKKREAENNARYKQNQEKKVTREQSRAGKGFPGEGHAKEVRQHPDRAGSVATRYPEIQKKVNERTKRNATMGQEYSHYRNVEDAGRISPSGNSEMGPTSSQGKISGSQGKVSGKKTSTHAEAAKRKLKRYGR